MKRIRQLIPAIARMPNLYLAFYKAKRGKQTKQEVVEFGKNLRQNLLEMRQQILKGKVDIGDYHYFTIHDPKERIICASSFRERVLQHALMNVCHQHFERFQIYNSYACRVGKGTYAALDRAQFFSANYAYFAKLDVRKYFETIDQLLLKFHLSRLFKDPKLLTILFQIIDSYQNEPHKGVPIGNLSSQYFANHFLGVADHYAKNELGLKAYVRYMDDMVLWDHDLERLKRKVQAFTHFLENQLNCNMKPMVLNRMESGLPFLGYVVYPDKIHLAIRSRKRFARKLKHLNHLLSHQLIDEAAYQRKILPLLAFTQKADAYLFRKKLLLEQGGQA